MPTTKQPLESADHAAAATMARIAMPLLRVSLGITYLWFGALKVAGVSPIEDFVGDTVPVLPRKPFVRGLGVCEMLIGIALLLRVALRPTLLLYFAQLGGTFLPFVVQPRRMFRNNNPLLLTTEGEFVLKNLVLLSAGLAVGSSVRRGDEKLPVHDQPLH